MQEETKEQIVQLVAAIREGSEVTMAACKLKSCSQGARLDTADLHFRSLHYLPETLFQVSYTCRACLYWLKRQPPDLRHLICCRRFELHQATQSLSQHNLHVKACALPQTTFNGAFSRLYAKLSFQDQVCPQGYVAISTGSLAMHTMDCTSCIRLCDIHPNCNKTVLQHASRP